LSQKGLEEKKETHWFIRMFKPRLWVILGGGIFLLLLIQIGLKETFSALKSVKPSHLLASVGLIVIGQQFIPFIKWVIMCHKAKMGLKLERILFLSSSILLGGTFTPARTGEFAVAFFINETKGNISSIVLFNRVLESSFTLLMTILIFSLFFRNFLPSKSWILIGLVLGVISILCLLVVKKSWGIFILSKGKKVLIRLKKHKPFQIILNLEEKIVMEVNLFYTTMKRLFSPRVVVVLILFTLTSWVIMMGANRFLFSSVGSYVPFSIIAAVMVLSAIGSYLSPTPGGIGIGDIPPVYFLFINGYRENIGAYILLMRAAVYLVTLGWYFFSATLYRKALSSKDKLLLPNR
jgi:uncharacterized protein (TIRG00374 family)